MNESTVKYLAGLMDADGCFAFETPPYKGGRSTIHGRLNLNLTEQTSRKLMDELADEFSVNIAEMPKAKEHHSAQLIFRLNKTSSLERLVPRLVKHMRIKAKYWEWILETVRENRGKNFSQDEVAEIRQEAKRRRKDTGSKKNVKPSWAWVAGFLDGDGHYSHRHQKQKHVAKDGKVTYHAKMTRLIQVEIHKEDKPGIDALISLLGGKSSIVNTRPNLLRWRLILGKSKNDKALRIFTKLVKYSRLKQHKLQTMIHDIRSQRLSNQGSTE